MSQTRKLSIVDFIQRKDRFYKKLGTENLYLNKVDSETIKELFGACHNKSERRAIILRYDQETKQNPFHYIFSNLLFSQGHPSGKYYIASRSIFTADITAASKEDEAVALFKNIEDKEKFAEKRGFVPKQTLNHYFSSDIKEFIENENSRIIDLLFEPFECEKKDADIEFVAAMSAKDSNGKTPLHHLVLNNERLAQFCDLIFKRISTLKDDHKKTILFSVDDRGYTILHDLLGLANKISWLKDTYGETLLLENLVIEGESNKKNSFYRALEFGWLKKENIDVICGLKWTKEGIEKLFKQSAGEKNPLHYLDEFSDELIKLMGREFFERKMLEKDKDGNSPLHTALRAKKPKLVEAFLANLSSKTKNLLLVKYENKDKEDALDVAVKSGNTESLKIIATAYPAESLYKKISYAPKPSVLDSNNPDILFTAGSHKLVLPIRLFRPVFGPLFDIYHYLVSNYPRNSRSIPTAAEKNARDFSNCLAALKNEKPFSVLRVSELQKTLPISMSTAIFLYARYPEFRKRLSEVEISTYGIEFFETFLKQQASYDSNIGACVIARIMLELTGIKNTLSPAEAPNLISFQDGAVNALQTHPIQSSSPAVSVIVSLPPSLDLAPSAPPPYPDYPLVGSSFNFFNREQQLEALRMQKEALERQISNLEGEHIGPHK